MSKMTFSEDLVWALGLSLLLSGGAHLSKAGRADNYGKCLRITTKESEEHAARWITSRQDTFHYEIFFSNAGWSLSYFMSA